LPFQGWVGFVAMQTQGDALGWRVVAPLARTTITIALAKYQENRASCR
jgi:hypothetical protein